MASRTPDRADRHTATEALRVCWKVVAEGSVTSIVACTLLALIERALVLVAAVGWQFPWFKYVLVGVAGTALVYRGFRVHLRTAATARAFERVVDAASNDEAVIEQTQSMAIVEATHNATRAVTDIIIPFVADVAATIGGIALVIALTGSSLLELAAAAVVAVGLVGAKLLSRRSDVAFENYLAMIDGVVDAFEGRAELLASGESETFAQRTKRQITRWRTAALASELRAAVATRLPIVVAAVIALAVVLTRGVDPALVRNGVLFLTTASAFVGVVRAIHELTKLWTRVAALEPVAFATRTVSGSEVVPIQSIALTDVTVAYGAHVVVSRMSLEFVRGEAVALVGPNGSGKTSLLLVTLGMRRPAHGQVLLSGTDSRNVDLRAWRRLVSYLPQRPYLLPRRDVRAAMSFPAAKLDDATIRASLDRVGLWERLTTFGGDPLAVLTDSLSAGERQRLAIARAICKDAQVFVLDEPDANLDAQGVTWVAELIRELAASGKIVIVAAHTEEVIAAANRTVQLDARDAASGEARKASAAHDAASVDCC